MLDTTANYLAAADLLITYGRDVTARVAAEERVHESEERFEQFAAHFPGYLFMNDEDLRCVFTNRPDEVEGGIRRADWMGKRPTEIWDGQYAVDSEDRLRRVLRRGSSTPSCRGRVRAVWSTCIPSTSASPAATSRR